MMAGSQTSAPVITARSAGKRLRFRSPGAPVINVSSVDTAIRCVTFSRLSASRMIAPAGTPRNWNTYAPTESGSSVSSIDTSKWNGARLKTRDAASKRSTRLWFLK